MVRFHFLAQFIILLIFNLNIMKTIIINCLNEDITSDIIQLYSQQETNFISLEVLDKDLFDFINSNSIIETIDQVSTINSLMTIKHSFGKDIKVVFINLLEKFIPNIKELSYIKMEYTKNNTNYVSYKLESSKTFLQ